MKVEIEVFHWRTMARCYCATDYFGGRTRFSETVQGAGEQVVRDTVLLFRRMISARKNPFRTANRASSWLKGTAVKIEIEV